jgi:pSer/pThr/pTyr-binding forkhead associated (FHA) protein
MATLCAIREDGSIAGQWELGGLPLVVGRGDATDAQIDDESASRRHSVILREGEHYIIEDLGSQNGTWVDGRRVLAARLSHNARILVGRTQFIFLDHEPSAVTAARNPPPSPGPDAPVRSGSPVFPALSRSGPGLGKQA